jgi:hypothetical protein
MDLVGLIPASYQASRERVRADLAVVRLGWWTTSTGPSGKRGPHLRSAPSPSS